MAYDRQIAMATRLIEKKGAKVTWSKNVTTQSGSQPWKTTAGVTPELYQVSMVFLSPKDNLIHLIKGSNVPQGAPDAIMATVPFTPEIDDSVITSTETFVIKAIDIVKPDGVPILYKLKFA